MRILVALINKLVGVKNNLGDFVGSDRPFASSRIKDINYPTLLRHVDHLENNAPKLHMKVGADISMEEFDDAHRRLEVYKELLDDAESKFVTYLQKKGYKVNDEESLKERIQRESLMYLKDIEKKGRDKSAHFFTDMIYEETHADMVVEHSVEELVKRDQLLDDNWDAFNDEEELGKKALVLEYLKQQLHVGALGQKFGESRKIAFFLVADFLKSYVAHSKIVTFGDMWAVLPEKKPCSDPKDAMIKLKVEIP